MKKYLFVATVALIGLVSCNKDLDNDKTVPANQKDGVVELFVKAPVLTDAATKAAIDNTSGTFSWSAGDEVAVKTDADKVYKFKAEGTGSDVRFTYTGTIEGTPATVVYPYTDNGEVADIPTEISGLEGALAADAIRLSGTIDAGSVQMNYVNAFLKLTFENVPTFANAIQVWEGSTERKVTFTKLSERGTISAYVPIYPGNINLTANLLDDAGNVIVGKYKGGVVFNAGALKKMAPLSIGNIISITNNSGWTDDENYYPALYIWQVNNINNDKWATTKSGEYAGYGDLKKLSDGTLYYILDQEGTSWLSEGSSIGVKFQTEPYDESKTTDTGCVYLYRDLNFTVPSGGGMVTSYRCYAKFNSTSWAGWKDKGTEVVKFNGYWFTDGEDNKFANWVDCTVDSSSFSDTIAYYEFQDSYYGHGNVGFAFYNPNDTGWVKRWGEAVTVNRDYLIDFSY